MKAAIVIILVILGGGLVYWGISKQDSGVPATETTQQETQQTTDQNPFGDGSKNVGTTDGVTLEVLATHDLASDCWVAYKGIVYDITNWLPRHPGSSAAIEPYCGTAEAFANAFNGQHGTHQEGRLEKEGTVEGQLAQ